METPQIEKLLSASDMEAECDKRYVGERFCGLATQSEAQNYGIELHEICKKVNQWRVAHQKSEEKEPSVEQIRDWVANSKVQPNEYDRAEKSILWWQARTVGTVPIDAERLTHVQVGKHKAVFKPDCVRVDEEGALIIDDYKTGWVPSEEKSRKSIRHRFYAIASRNFFQLPTIKTVLWNISEEYSIVIEWTPEELERFEPYVARIADQRVERIAVIEAIPQEGRLALMKDDVQCPSRINWFCASCAINRECEKFRNLVMYGVFPLGSTEMEQLDMLRTAKHVIEKAEGVFADSLKAQVLEKGERTTKTVKSTGKVIPMRVLRDGEWIAVVEFNESKLKETDQTSLRTDLLRQTVTWDETKAGKKTGEYALDFGNGLKASLRISKEKLAEFLDKINPKTRTRTTKKLTVGREA